MSTRHPEFSRHCSGATAVHGGHRYRVELAVAEQPVKPSRRPLRCISAIVSCDGQPVPDADVTLSFHPLHAPAPAPDAPGCHGELLLAPDHHPAARSGELHGSMALESGEWKVNVTINREVRAAFAMLM